MKGFTLIEVLVVSTIIMLLTGGVVVNYTAFNDKQKVQQAAAKLKNDLRLVQSKALSGEQPATCTEFVGYQTTFTTTSYTAAISCNPAIATDPIVSGTLPSGVTFFPQPASLTFLPLNRGVSEEQTITLTGATTSFTVKVERSGTITDAVVPTPTPTPPFGQSNGLVGDYYDVYDAASGDCSSKVLTRVDNTVNFNWLRESPDPALGANTFCVKWNGYVETPSFSPSPGDFTFYVVSNDGNRVWVDGQQLINKWVDGTWDVKKKVTLAANQKYSIRLEMYDRKGDAQVTLSWSGPSLTKQVIKRKYLFTTP